MGKCFKIFLEGLKLVVNCMLYPWNVERRKSTSTQQTSYQMYIQGI